jgi:o-succinylbenzoate synthase
VSVCLRLHPYRLPLRRPWHSARQRIDERRGWLVAADHGGLCGYGDCAPLPEAGTETPTSALNRLRHWCRRARQAPAQALLDALAAQWPSPAPAADAAVECALLDLAARRAGVTLRRLLAELPPSSPALPIPTGADFGRIGVNAMAGAAATATDAAVDAAVAAGFRVIKLKLGIADRGTELGRVAELLERLPVGTSLRLDANGAWRADEARTAVAALVELDAGSGRVESLEEPLRAPDEDVLAALQDAAPFALALDESLARNGSMDPDRLPVRRLVLKPAAIGGLRATLDLARRAHAAGRETVLTGVVESAAGLWATAQLAAATGSPLAHGLGTAGWLAEDLGEAPAAVDGWIGLPAVAGSGFEPWFGLGRPD